MDLDILIKKQLQYFSKKEKNPKKSMEAILFSYGCNKISHFIKNCYFSNIILKSIFLLY